MLANGSESSGELIGRYLANECRTRCTFSAFIIYASYTDDTGRRHRQSFYLKISALGKDFLLGSNLELGAGYRAEGGLFQSGGFVLYDRLYRTGTHCITHSGRDSPPL